MRFRSLALTRGAVLATAFTFILHACSGGEDGPAAPRAAPSNELTAPTLSATTVAPFAPITLSGLPSARTDLVADVSAVGASRPDVDGAFLLPLVPLGGDRYELRIPLHPTALADGGPLDVRVRGTSLVTLPARLTLLSMPAAPGAYTRFLDAFQSLIDARLLDAGITRDSLLALDWDTELPATLLPLAISQTLLDDPAHDRGLRQLVSGSAAYTGLIGGATQMELLDRIIAYSGITALLEEELASVRADIRIAGVEAHPSIISISSGAELDAAMERARLAKLLNADGSTTKSLMNAYGLTLGAIGVVAGPAGAAAATGLGAGLYAYQTLLEGTAQLLPTSFVGGSLNFDPTIEEFYEDQDGPGQYINVTVSAQSEGWTLDKTILDGALVAAGGVDAVTTLIGRNPAAGDALRSLSSFVLSTIGSKRASSAGLITIDPQVWPNVDISGPGFTRARVQGDAIRLAALPNYEPVKAGTSTLTVETDPTRFGGAPSILERKNISVLAIEVRIKHNGTPPPLTGIPVEPNDQVMLSIEVENADDDTIEWTLSAGSWATEPIRVGVGRWSGTVQTPASTNDFPVTVLFRSTATGGARSEPGAPERAASALIVATKVVVNPNSVILSAGESQTFIAEVLGNDDQRVTWSATGPTGGAAAIGSGGTFVAPSVLGQYLVKATSVADPFAEGFADVLVVGQCYWSLQIDGPDGGSWSGEFAAHFFPFAPGGFFSSSFSLNDTDQDGPLGNITAAGPIAAGQTGSYLGTLGFTPAQGGGVQWTATNDEELGVSANLLVLANNGDNVRARMTGTAIRFVQNGDPILASFTLTVRSASFGDCGPG